jgi:hypothetical protein
MAYNTINWGKIYCSSNFGASTNLQTIEIASQPECLDTE